MDGDLPVVTAQIAHIRAARPDGPRYDDPMTDDERHAFRNLILLRTFHHASVDGPETGSACSVEELTEWKTKGEGAVASDLRASPRTARFGSVNAAYRWLTWGAMPLGSLIGGVVVEIADVRAVLLASGILASAAALPVPRSRDPKVEAPNISEVPAGEPR